MIYYDKAIRDKIPEIIQKDGYSCNVKTLSDEEFLDLCLKVCKDFNLI